MCPASPPTLASGLWVAPLHLCFCPSTVWVQLSEGILILLLLVFLRVCLTVGGVGRWIRMGAMEMWLPPGPFSPWVLGKFWDVPLWSRVGQVVEALSPAWGWEGGWAGGRGRGVQH